MCKSKIHRARITDSNLDYVGSITIDESLMKATDLMEYEEVHVLNINNGARFVTYVLKGEPDTGMICVNGAASRMVQRNDLVIIVSYAGYRENELEAFSPKHIMVNSDNKIITNCQDIFQDQLKLFKTAETD